MSRPPNRTRRRALRAFSALAPPTPGARKDARHDEGPSPRNLALRMGDQRLVEPFSEGRKG